MNRAALIVVLLAASSCGRVAFDPSDVTGDAGLGDGSGLDAGGPGPRIAYLKASNTDAGDQFGHSLAVSSDGSTIAIGAPLEGGMNGPGDNLAPEAGAVYVFVTDGSTWMQQAYVKPETIQQFDQFGWSVDLSADGNTLVVGARREDSSVASDPLDNAASASGAAYVFTRSGTEWKQQAYVKASTIDAGDSFGERVAIAGDGRTIAVGAPQEDSDGDGVGSDQAGNTADAAGAVYVFQLMLSTWVQTAYIKASNSGAGDELGYRLAMTGDGSRLAVGAHREDSALSGPDVIPSDDTLSNSGVVYVFANTVTGWSQLSAIKASNPDAGDNFGYAVAYAQNGKALAVAAEGESSSAAGLAGNQNDNSLMASGAGYVFATEPFAQENYIKAIDPDSNDEMGYCISLGLLGRTVAIGAPLEDSAATGVDGDSADDSAPDSGAVYFLDREAERFYYMKATNTGPGDQFGWACSSGTDVLAVSAPFEDGSATGVDGPTDEAAADAGAVYVYY